MIDEYKIRTGIEKAKKLGYRVQPGLMKLTNGNSACALVASALGNELMSKTQAKKDDCAFYKAARELKLTVKEMEDFTGGFDSVDRRSRSKAFLLGRSLRSLIDT